MRQITKTINEIKRNKERIAEIKKIFKEANDADTDNYLPNWCSLFGEECELETRTKALDKKLPSLVQDEALATIQRFREATTPKARRFEREHLHELEKICPQVNIKQIIKNFDKIIEALPARWVLNYLAKERTLAEAEAEIIKPTKDQIIDWILED